MGYGNRTPMSYFKIKDGKIHVYNRDDEPTIHDFFKGKLIQIDFRESEVQFNGKLNKIKNWNVMFEDDGVNHIWSTKYDGILFQSFINCIASLTDFNSTIELYPYMKDGKTKLWMKANGEDLRWKFNVDEMPKITPLIAEGEPVLDAQGNQMYSTKARMEWTQKLVEAINAKIRSVKQVEVHEDSFVEEVEQF
ncbi:MAG: hypothetical protein KF896_15760 [Ignavibacteriae bacterium]|nr:hypothetical protein [Ignavibacteriota bacterium]